MAELGDLMILVAVAAGVAVCVVYVYLADRMVSGR